MQQMSIDFEAAQRRRVRGMESSAKRAERKHSGWVIQALDKLRGFVDRTSGTFTIEQARAAIQGDLPQPDDLRAWGQVTQMARRMGVIVPAGAAPAASSNGSLKPAYRRPAAH
jgi:hypothetical protein